MYLFYSASKRAFMHILTGTRWALPGSGGPGTPAPAGGWAAVQLAFFSLIFFQCCFAFLVLSVMSFRGFNSSGSGPPAGDMGPEERAG